MNNETKIVKMFKSKSGSTLIWAMVILLVLAIIISAGLVIAQSVSSRSVNKHVQQQSYYTALSATKSVAEWLNGTKTDNAEQATQTDFIEQLISEGAVTFDSSVSTSMGTSKTKVSINDNNGTINISSTAIYNEKKSTVTAKLTKSTQTVSGEEGTIDLEDPPSGEPETIDDVEGNTAGSPNQTYIWRCIEINGAGKNSLSLQLYNSNCGGSIWNTQYYRINPINNNPNTEVYIKLLNYNFPRSNGKNRDMLICSGGPAPKSFAGTNRNQGTNTMGNDGSNTPYKRMTIYTEYDSRGESNTRYRSPLKNIVIAPQLQTHITSSIFTTYMDGYTTSSYPNMKIQINDTGQEYGYGGKLILVKGLSLTGKSSVYTKRNTEVSYAYVDSGKGNGDNMNVAGNNFILNGDFVTAGNTTNFHSGTDIRGNVTVKKTGSLRGVINMESGSVTSAGDIFIRNGGTLNLKSGATINGDVYVKPGGTLNIYGGTINGNVFAENGVVEGNTRAVMNIKGDFTVSGTEIVESDRTLPGGIYVLGGTGDNVYGAVFNYGPEGYKINVQGRKNIVHVQSGTIVSNDLQGRYYCTGHLEVCPHLLTKFDVDKWTISGYSSD